MGSETSTTIATSGADDLLDSLISGERGGKLRTQLATRFPECSAEQIEDALQYGCKCFLDEAEDISAPGTVYTWIRTAACSAPRSTRARRRTALPLDH